MRTFPYNMSQNLIGYGVLRKHPSLSKTQTCENIELTVSKKNNIMTHFSPSLWVLWIPMYEILVRTLHWAVSLSH